MKQLDPLAKTIRISDNLHERIRKQGAKGETYESIVEKMVSFYEKEGKNKK
jgi:hypothetical protein